MSQFLQIVIIGLQQGSVYALIALGYTMVYGVLRLINFAHGDVFMLGAFVGFFAAEKLRIGEQPSLAVALIKLLPILLIAMVVCAVVGLLIERLAYRPLRRAPRLTALITAIGVSLFLENGAVLLFSPTFRYLNVTPQSGQTISVGGALVSKNQLVLVVAAALLMAVLWYIVQRTKVGKAMRAVSQDADAAALMGINTDGVIAFTFGLGSALAGAGGLLFAALAQAKIFPLMGVTMGLKAFVAAVVGGIGSLPGAMLGGLLIGLSESFVRASPALSRWTEAVAFVLLIAVLLLRPSGLLGRFAPEKV
jgi:branched-chain amino acid transport system permease protein